MVKIESFQDGIEYVKRLGLTVRPGFPGWIPAAQERMCDTEETLYNAAGRQYPYNVHYHRKERKFTVNGSITVDASRM